MNNTVDPTVIKTQAQRSHSGFNHNLTVHLIRFDHLPAGNLIQRFNKKLAIRITKTVGTMWAAYVFALLSLCSLPAILTQAFHLTIFPGWLISASLIALVAWVSSYFLQLVLLPILMVGQNIQGEAGDARAAKTFQDTETIVDRLDTETAGGLQTVLAAIRALEEKLPPCEPSTQSTMILKLCAPGWRKARKNPQPGRPRGCTLTASWKSASSGRIILPSTSRVNDRLPFAGLCCG